VSDKLFLAVGTTMLGERSRKTAHLLLLFTSDILAHLFRFPGSNMAHSLQKLGAALSSFGFGSS